ncbi:hypothetical protein JCM11641_007447 [Rhodosporidiobolus odoratus]
MAPSLLQTLLREPTRSYQDIYAEPHARPTSPSSLSSQRQRRPSSVRSVGSTSNYGGYSTDATSAGAAGGGAGAARPAAWKDGKWEWSAFGGRGGLTGGARSLYTPSVVGKSLGVGIEQQMPGAGRRASSLRSAMSADRRAGFNEQDEAMSVHSGRSARSGISQDSIRTSMSAPGQGDVVRDRKGKKNTRSASVSASSLHATGDRYDQPRNRTRSFGAEPSQRYSSRGPSASMSTSFVRQEGEQTSRRYSSMSSLPTSYSTPPSLSIVSASSSSSPKKRRTKSPLSHLPVSDDTTPSLTSSASSAPSSPPTTPIQPILAPIPPLTLEPPTHIKGKKSKHKRVPSAAAVEEAIAQVGLPPKKLKESAQPVHAHSEEIAQTSQQAEETTTSQPASSATVPVPGKFYSVDELFALATPDSAAAPASAQAALVSSGPSSPSVLSAAAPALPRADSDSGSFKTASDGVSPPVSPTAGLPPLAPLVPRLKLTRTESDQMREGKWGSVEIDVPEVEEQVEEDSGESSEEAEEDASSVPETAEPVEEESVAPPAAPVEPQPAQVARFVEAKRSRSKRNSASLASATPSTTSSTYEVIRSSPNRASANPPRSVSPAFSEASSTSSSSSAAAAADVPDWLKRIRALGEPIQPLSAGPPPRQKAQQKQRLAPPAHWTVQQLRERESPSSSGSSSSSGPQPPIGRPRSVGSLRSRAKVMDVMHEEAEAEAAAAAEEHEERQRSASLGVTPAWVRRKDGNGSVRSVSPASFAPSNGGHGRRSRSVDLSLADRDQFFLKPSSPLGRSTSLISSSSSTGGSSTCSRTYSEADIEAIASAAAARPKTGFAKLFAPPLASSKAEPKEEKKRVVNASRTQKAQSLYEELQGKRKRETPSPGPTRAASLREFSVRRPSSLRELVTPPPEVEEEPEREDEVAHDDDGRSEISTMSAPQLSPSRPPRNPARVPSVPSIPQAILQSFPSTAPSPADVPLPASRPASIISSVTPSPIIEDARRAPRPLSRSFSEVEHASMHTTRTEPPPPMPILPILSRPTSPSPSAVPAASASASARPFSSLLDPAYTVSGPSSLALSPRIDFGKKKTSRRFGLFKRSSHADLSSASSSSSSKAFASQTDLVYESLDVAGLRKRVRSDEVVVEVIAVGVDKWDREKVWQVAKGMGGAGFVPGRALVGKVVEVGEGVSRVKKGEMVWALNSVKKSSSLASYVALSRDHVSLAPSLANSAVPLAHLAALPSPAFIAMLIMSTLCGTLPKGSKVLVLNAHQGVGLYCLQIARHLRPGAGGAGARDLWMVAQCSMAVVNGDSVCTEAGATEVVRDEPLAAINEMYEGSFDVVIDTIGGRRLYDASRRILHHSGQFITTVGDSLTPASGSSTSAPSSSSNENFRSLRRAFFKKDKKAVSYWRVNPDGDERAAVRETLDQVKEAVEAGGIKPSVSKELSFKDVRATFEARQAETEGVVVRVKEV